MRFQLTLPDTGLLSKWLNEDDSERPSTPNWSSKFVLKNLRFLLICPCHHLCNTSIHKFNLPSYKKPVIISWVFHSGFSSYYITLEKVSLVLSKAT